MGSRLLIIRCGSVTQTAYRPAFAECYARATCRWRRGNDVAPREMWLQFAGCIRSRDHHQALFKRAFADFSRYPLLSLKTNICGENGKQDPSRPKMDEMTIVVFLTNTCFFYPDNDQQKPDSASSESLQECDDSALQEPKKLQPWSALETKQQC